MLHIRLLESVDIPEIVAAFKAIGWHKPAIQYERYLAEQHAGDRVVYVAFWGGTPVNAMERCTFAGYNTVCWQSAYPPFRAAAIPEIKDFNVLPQFRRRGIGTQLMDRCEQAIAERADACELPRIAGIGVGLTADYGAAQRLYTKRGYVLDGRGLFYRDEPVSYGYQLRVDDDLVLYLTKRL